MNILQKIFRESFYNSPLTVRELAKYLEIAPATAAKYTKRLYYQDLIKIRVVGRAYYLYPNISNKLIPFYLLSSEIEFTISKLKEMKELLKIDRRSEILLVYGSRASNYFTDLSDLDLLATSKDELLKLIGKPFLDSIMKRHIILKGFEPFVEVAMKWRSSFGASA